MGKFRKASQLASELQQLCQNQEEIRSRTSPYDRDKRLLEAILPQHLNAKLQTKAYADGGNGLMFMFSNANAVLMGHLKFHTPRNSETKRDDAYMSNFHMVIEGIKFLRKDGSEVEIRFGDNIRTKENTPAHGDNTFCVNGQKCAAIRDIRLEKSSLKPVLKINSHLDRRTHKIVYNRPVTESYLVLGEDISAMSDIGELLHGASALANNFYKTAMSSNSTLFKENKQGTADKLIDITDDQIEHQVSDNNFNQQTVTQAFQAVPQKAPPAPVVVTAETESSSYAKSFPSITVK